MELFREVIDFYNGMASVCNDAKASQNFIKDTMNYLEEEYHVLGSRRDFQEVSDPYKLQGSPYSTVQYIDIDRNYRYTYDYRYYFYTHKEYCRSSRNFDLVEELEFNYRKSNPDCTEEDITNLHNNIYVGIELVRKWTDATHYSPKTLYFMEEGRKVPYFRFKYHDDNELFSAMRMLIADDILKENNVDIFDIVPRIEVERDYKGV